MVFFFHHYELPAILQQARIQQIIIESQAQQGNENNGSDRTDGSGGGGGGGEQEDNDRNSENNENNQTDIGGFKNLFFLLLYSKVILKMI